MEINTERILKMNEFEFLDINDYNIELSDEEKEQTVIEFESDHFYILKYLLSTNDLITINGIKFTIEEIYNLLVQEGNQVDLLENGTEVVLSEINDYFTKSVNGMGKIINVSRHKVTKNKWKITIDAEHSLDITEDHSIIVYRDSELIECKPYEILDTDYIIMKNE